MNIRHILIMTDFSDIARSAYASAVDVASRLDAMIHLVHFSSVVPSFMPQLDREQYFGNLEEALSSETRTHPNLAKANVTPHLQRKRWTRSRQRALEEELEIGLVVVSPTGRSGIPLVLLGSFADRVIQLHPYRFSCLDGGETRGRLILKAFWFRTISTTLPQPACDGDACTRAILVKRPPGSPETLRCDLVPRKDSGVTNSLFISRRKERCG